MQHVCQASRQNSIVVAVAQQPIGIILHACQKLGSVIDANVAVVGQGQNCLMMTQMLANMGARRIISLDLFYTLKNQCVWFLQLIYVMVQ
jgi:threonine dehydrogenase-like Zn-dependent dehydrogenase